MASEIKFNRAVVLRAMERRKMRVFTATRKSLNEIGRTTVNMAKALVPVSSGTLRASIGYRLTWNGYSGHVDVGAIRREGKEVPPHAKIQDVGGVVRPKLARMLAIPIHEKVKANGRKKAARARDVIEDPEKYGFRRIFFTPKAIMGIRNDSMVFDILYARRSSVTIKGTGYLQRPMRQMANGGASEILHRNIEKAMSIKAPGSK